ncbi:MAG: hypothetical protein DI589_05810 [Shinella sp.]|nr:MAG: hypothetical protein DI589_05810 [Shinella sp.]
MNDDDELSEEQQRRMAAKLLGNSKKQSVPVETRRRRSKSVEQKMIQEVRFVDVSDEADGCWLHCDVYRKAPTGWVKVRTIEKRGAAKAEADRYRQEGAVVAWEEIRV